MAVNTSSVTMTDIQSEFGGTNPIGLSEYYANKTQVPEGTWKNVYLGINTTSYITTSGPITLGEFRGAYLSYNYITNGTTTTVTSLKGFNITSTYIGFNNSTISPGKFGSMNNTTTFWVTGYSKGSPVSVSVTVNSAYWYQNVQNNVPGAQTIVVNLSGNTIGSVDNVRIGKTPLATANTTSAIYSNPTTEYRWNATATNVNSGQLTTSSRVKFSVWLNAYRFDSGFGDT